MKIRRYTVGGITYTPFVPGGQQSASAGSSSGSSSGSDKDTSEKITGTIKKEIVDILKSNGLPGDVNAFLNSANSFLSSSMSLSNMSLFGGTNNDYDLSELIRIQSLANEVAWNKSKHTEAVTNLNDQDAWGEVATDSRGYLYIINKDGQIDTVSPDKFKTGEHQAITNEQLLGLREQNPQFAMNSNILTGMTGAVGMKTIQDYLRKLSSELGTNGVQGYASKKGAQISHGIQALMEAGPDGYYKISDETQARDINVALEYLYQNLTPQMKRTLTATVAANGGDVNKDTVKFIGMILMNNIDTKQTVDHDKDFDDATGGSGSSGSGSSEKKVEMTLAEGYSTGYGFDALKPMKLISKNNDVPVYVLGQNLGPVLQQNQKQAIGDVNLEVLLNDAYGVGTIVDRSSITFGDQVVSWEDAGKLMYKGDGNMYRVWMPAVNDNGRIRPDFETQEKLNQIREKTEGMTPGQIKTLVSKIDGVHYDEESGTVVADNMHAFISFSAVASDDGFNKSIKGSSYLHDMTNDEDRRLKQRYNDAVGVRYTVDGTNNRDKSHNKGATWWWGYNFYEGNVFIPMNETIISKAIYNNELVPQSTYENTSAKAEEKYRQSIIGQAVDLAQSQGNLKLNF